MHFHCNRCHQISIFFELSPLQILCEIEVNFRLTNLPRLCIGLTTNIIQRDTNQKQHRPFGADAAFLLFFVF